MILLDLIIRHKLYLINNDLWKYLPLTFKVLGDGSIELTLYTNTATDNHYLQYSFDGNTWEYAVLEIAPISTTDNFKARYKIATIAAGKSIKLRGNVLLSSIHGTFSTKKHGDVFYDVYGNPASLYSSNAFVNIENVDLTELFANYIDEEINKFLYYDNDTLSWKSSGTTEIYEKESSTIKYGRVTSIYQDNVLRSIKNLWLQHSNGIYTKMFIGSLVKTLTDYMPISGKCKGMFYSSQIISNDLSLQLPSTTSSHNYEGMFAYCPNIRNITINIEDNDIYAGMFLGCNNLEKINVTYSNITNSLSKTIKSMFFECYNINLFNITLNNISVPVFDEYFRFTIPNTLTDCSNSVLNINNISTVSPVWKIFENSNIESTPVINNTNYLSLNNIFNFENIEFVSHFDYKSNMNKLEFSNNLKLIYLTGIPYLKIDCAHFFSSFINNLLSPTLIINDLYLYEFKNHNVIKGMIGPLEIEPNHEVSQYYNVPRFNGIYSNCNEFEDCENINLENYFFCSGVKTKSDFEIKFNFDITTTPSVNLLYFLFSDFKKTGSERVLSLFAFILHGASAYDTGLIVFGNKPSHTSSYSSFLTASTIHLIKQNNLISIKVDDNTVLNNYQLDDSYEDTYIYIGGIPKICNYIEVNDNRFIPIKLNNNILAMKNNNGIYPLFPISKEYFP